MQTNSLSFGSEVIPVLPLLLSLRDFHPQLTRGPRQRSPKEGTLTGVGTDPAGFALALCKSVTCEGRSAPGSAAAPRAGLAQRGSPASASP